MRINCNFVFKRPGALFARVFLVFGLICKCSISHSAIRVWDGETDSQWLLATNWDGNVSAPGATDAIQIGNTVNKPIISAAGSGGVTFGSLTFTAAGAELTIQGNYAGAAIVSNVGAATIHMSGGTVTGSALTWSTGSILNLSGGTITFSGNANLNLEAVINFTGGNLNIGGATNNLTAGGRILMNTGVPALAYTNAGGALSINFKSAGGINGGIVMSAGSVTLAGALNLDGGDNTTASNPKIDVSGGTFTVAGATTFKGEDSDNPNIIVSGDTTTTIVTFTGNVTNESAGSDDVNMDIDVSGGKLIFKGNLEMDDPEGGSGVLGGDNFTVTGSNSLVQFEGNPKVWTNYGTFDASGATGTSSITFKGSTSFVTIATAIWNFYDIIIASGKTMDQSNITSINVYGDWANNGGTFTPGSTSVVFKSTIAGPSQNITTAETFYNLKIDNSHATGYTCLTGGNVAATNLLHMADGNISLSSYIITLGTSTANLGTLTHPGSGQMFGSGGLKRWISGSAIADGSAVGHFPMGNTVDYRPLYLSSVGAFTGGTMTVSHTNATTVSIVNYDDAGTAIVRKHDAYWTSTTGDGLAGAAFRLRGIGTGFGTIQEVADIRLTIASGLVGVHLAAAGTPSNPMAKRITLSAAELNNSFHIGSTDAPNSPLPIELLDFDAKLNEQKVDISWSTAAEINNDFFTLERAASYSHSYPLNPQPRAASSFSGGAMGDFEGLQFEAIGTVDGAGNSTQTLIYEFIDAGIPSQHPVHSTPYYYYRLKQTDFDGKYSYSSIVAVDFSRANKKSGISELEFSVYPNPTANDFFVAITGGIFSEASIKVTDVLGRTCSSTVIYPDNLNEHIISFGNADWLAAGVYYVSVSSKNEVFLQEKLVVTR